MRLLFLIPVFSAVLFLSSCILGGGTKTPRTPVAPAALDPAAAAKPPAPPAPLSSPQTDIHLPPEQVITPEALASIQVPEPPVPEPAPAPKTPPSKKQAPVASAPKPETPAGPETPAPVNVGPVTPPLPVAEEPPKLQPVYGEEERRRILAELDRRRNETEGLLRGLNQNRLSSEQRASVERVRSFINVADDMVKRGDLHSADGFSTRALILARELASGR
jgi:hypothetical protein